MVDVDERVAKLTAIERGNHKASEIQGQTWQHSRLINLLGVKQICIDVNKMDCDTAVYMKNCYDENMLTGASQADVEFIMVPADGSFNDEFCSIGFY